MNILFFAFSEMCKIYCKIAQSIEEKDDIEVDKYYFLTESTVFENYINQNAPQGKSEIIYMYKNFNLNKIKSIDFQKLKDAEEKYGRPNFWLYVNSDRYFRRFREEKILKGIQWYVDFYENLLDKYRFDVAIFSDIGGLNSGLLHRVAKEKGVITFSILQSSLPEPSRVYISDNVYLIPDELEKVYYELLKRELSDEEKKLVQSIVNYYRNKTPKASSLLLFESKKTNYFNIARNIFKKIFDYYFSGIKNIYHFSDLVVNAVFVIKIRAFILNTFYKGLFEEPNLNEKYVYYPLHFEPELTIDLFAPFYMDQVYLIENIAKCLPIEYKLYVKEHPASIGLRRISYYKRIIKIPLVKLIMTDTNNLELIKNSKCITTISGTTGWEGLIIGKPVITFGHNFFNIMRDSVFFVKDFFALPLLFKKIFSDFKPNEENILKFCYSKYATTYPGSMMPPTFDKDVLSSENISNLYKVIIKEIYKRKNLKKNIL